MTEVNLNDFAKDIAEKEGLKEQVSIAQIKEVLRHTFIKLSDLRGSEVLGIIEKYARGELGK